jgi:hypothetical protein
MRRLALLVAVGMATTTGLAGADEKDAKAIVRRAIASHGGTEALTKTLKCKRTDKGKQAVVDKEEPFVSRVTRDLPGKIRLQIKLGKTFETTIVLDGETGWQADNGGPATKMLATRTREVREEAFLWYIATLVPLLNPEFTLSTLPETKVGTEAVVGVKVERKGHADTKLYFSKRNGILISAERRVFEAGLAVDKEYLYEGHRSFGGAMLPTKETVKVNKRKWTEFAIGDYTFPTKFDAATFAKP